MMDEHGWWLRFADNTYPKEACVIPVVFRIAGSRSTEIGGPLMETSYAKTGWLRDGDYGGWFYMDLEHGMQTGWVLLDGVWYYLQPDFRWKERDDVCRTKDTGWILCREKRCLGRKETKQ